MAIFGSESFINRPLKMLDSLDILEKLESVECIKSHEGLWKVSLKLFHQFITYLTLIID